MKAYFPPQKLGDLTVWKVPRRDRRERLRATKKRNRARRLDASLVRRKPRLFQDSVVSTPFHESMKIPDTTSSAPPEDAAAADPKPTSAGPVANGPHPDVASQAPCVENSLADELPITGTSNENFSGWPDNCLECGVPKNPCRCDDDLDRVMFSPKIKADRRGRN